MVSLRLSGVDSRMNSRSKGISYAIGLGVIWGVLATLNPTSTYHLAPLLVAASPPALAGLGGVEERRDLGLLAAMGTGLAVVFSVGLSAAGSLNGPSLLPVGGPAVESFVFGVAGGLAAYLIATGRRFRPST